MNTAATVRDWMCGATTFTLAVLVSAASAVTPQLGV